MKGWGGFLVGGKSPGAVAQISRHSTDGGATASDLAPCVVGDGRY